jgi:hypothetical protein
MTAQTCLHRPVQRNLRRSPKPTGQSLNVEAECPHSSGNGPLESEWITEELIARTQDVWGRYLEREVAREEAIEMLLNVQRIALAFYQASMEDAHE